MGDLKEAGKMGPRHASTLKCYRLSPWWVGLLVVNILKPGVGMNVDAAKVRRIVNLNALTVADANAARSDEIALPHSQ